VGVVHDEHDAFSLQASLLYENGEQIALLDLGELPWSEIGAQQQAGKDGDCVLLRAATLQHDAFTRESVRDMVDERGLTGRGGRRAAEFVYCEKAGSGPPVGSPEPDLVRRWSRKHSRGRHQTACFRHGRFPSLLASY